MENKEYDEVGEFLKFECQKCAEALEKDGKLICDWDGKEHDKHDTCSHWW